MVRTRRAFVQVRDAGAAFAGVFDADAARAQAVAAGATSF